MKTPQNQKSILSFFGPPASKASQTNFASTVKNKVGTENSTKTLENEDSPIKKVMRRQRRAIESDSEEEIESSARENKEEVNKVSSPVKKRARALSPILLEDSGEETHRTESPKASASTSQKNDVGFSPETVPPLRKTARKKMQRESGAVEEQQLEMVKRLKSPIKEDLLCPESSGKKINESKNKNDEVEPSKKGKRTNSLDRFVFVKIARNKPSEVKEESVCSNTSSQPSVQQLRENKDPSSSSVNTDQKEASPTRKSQLDKETPTPNKTPKRRSSSRKKSQTPEKGVSPKTKAPTPHKNTELTATTTTEVESSSSSPKRRVADPSPCDETSAPSPHKSTPPSSGKNVSLTNKQTTKTPFSIVRQDDKKEDFNPAKNRYHPIEDASWQRGQDVPFSALSKTFKIIEEISGRLKTIEILANFLRSVIVLTPEDLLYCVYLCLNKVAPSFEGIELGVGEIYICRAIAQVTGRSVDKIKSEIAEKGDLGIVAEHSKSNQRMMFQPAPLTVKKVFKSVKEIALMSGQASQARKIEKMKSMLVACKGPEARFLIRFFGGKLRIGLAEQSALQAIAQACFLTPPGQSYPPEMLNGGKGLSPDNLKAKVEEFAAILKTTYCECPSFDSIIPVLLESGMRELPNHCKLQPGVPLKPMLAHPTKGVAEVLKRFDKSNFTCEFKYDGERAQIHLDEDGNVSIFSRNQENNTTKYPDIISRLKDSLGPDVKSCILDSESVAYDVNEKKILPFQRLSTRKKKDAEESEIKVQVCVFPFDLLYLNGRNLVTEALEVRRDLLRKNFIEREGQFTFAKSMDSTDTEDIEKFLEDSIKGNCEGLMVKSLDVEATYEIAKRSRNWLKLKKDYLEGVGDTIDVVVIGGFSGQGNRTGTYGGFLLACYDPESEEYQSLCKIGTGFTDDILKKHTAFLKEHVIDTPKSYYRFHSTLTPDAWFEPVQVWEIKCADLSVSPVHMAAIGIVDPEKGISLRFPRFLRIREDKSVENATSSSQIAELYRSQEQIKNQTETNNNMEEYFY